MTKIEKTKMCASISEGRQCLYGEKCKFAHSDQELKKRPQVDQTKFKTRVCLNYKKGCCTYGDNCVFIHEIQPQVPLSKTFPFENTFVKNEVKPNILSLDSFPPLKSKVSNNSGIIAKHNVDYKNIPNPIRDFNDKPIEIKLSELFGKKQETISPIEIETPKVEVPLKKSPIQSVPIPKNVSKTRPVFKSWADETDD